LQIVGQYESLLKQEAILSEKSGTTFLSLARPCHDKISKFRRGLKMTEAREQQYWLKSPLNEADTAKLQLHVEEAVLARQSQGTYTLPEREHIRQRKIFTQVQDKIPVEHLDAIRRLCQLWDVQVLPKNIQSHRKFIGPVIVWTKRKLFPIMEFVLKDCLRQQREFNAAAIQAIAEIASPKSDASLPKQSIGFFRDTRRDLC
jgi:hypothetical protein